MGKEVSSSIAAEVSDLPGDAGVPEASVELVYHIGCTRLEHCLHIILRAEIPEN